MAQKVIITPRMRLTLVESAELGSPHFIAMHKIKCDKDATSWSLEGPSKSIEDTRRRIRNALPVLSGVSSDDNQIKKDAEPDANYAKRFRATWIARARVDTANPDSVKNSAIITSNLTNDGETDSGHGESKNGSIQSDLDDQRDNAIEEDVSTDTVLGTVSLSSPLYYGIPLPPAFAPPASPELLRMNLGYMFLPEAWGKGYATEAAKAVVESYKNSTSWWQREINPSVPTKTKLWVSAVMCPLNVPSFRVAEKIGLDKMGVHSWDGEKVFIGGDWQKSEVLVYGKMIA